MCDRSDALLDAQITDVVYLMQHVIVILDGLGLLAMIKHALVIVQMLVCVVEVNAYVLKVEQELIVR